jgi:hypothetical protein
MLTECILLGNLSSYWNQLCSWKKVCKKEEASAWCVGTEFMMLSQKTIGHIKRPRKFISKESKAKERQKDSLKPRHGWEHN